MEDWNQPCATSTELKMTEWKSKVPYSSSSQSSIAALKNVLEDKRLTSSPPLPPTTHPLLHPPTTPIPYPYTYWDGLWVSQRWTAAQAARECCHQVGCRPGSNHPDGWLVGCNQGAQRGRGQARGAPGGFSYNRGRGVSRGKPAQARSVAQQPRGQMGPLLSPR